MPAFAAALIARHSRILGVHLNDGYGKWDNGLMVGAVHPIQTIELLVELERSGYNGAIYFDTFLTILVSILLVRRKLILRFCNGCELQPSG